MEEEVPPLLRNKLVNELLLGDLIVETDYVKRKPKQYQYKVTKIETAACSPFKTHVTVDGGIRRWCYDSGMEIEVR